MNPIQDHNSSSLLYNLSQIKNKVSQIESMATFLISQDPTTSITISNIEVIVQEIILYASSILLTCQQMAPIVLDSHKESTNQVLENGYPQSNHYPNGSDRDPSSFNQHGKQPVEWYSDHYNYNYNHKYNVSIDSVTRSIHNNNTTSYANYSVNESERDVACVIVELEAADLLAKYTHYCQVCGKGFKRDANLRMHMRAHGDKYKSSSSLANPMKEKLDKNDVFLTKRVSKKFSCPQQGCRWNQKHVKFHPLKSIICVKNHYKRSHCPKMYVCKRCNTKMFSVVSDLRTHEKHCGDPKWQCSCGTAFSRKDKLLSHVGLFVGHSPLVDVVSATRIKDVDDVIRLVKSNGI